MHKQNKSNPKKKAEVEPIFTFSWLLAIEQGSLPNQTLTQTNLQHKRLNCSLLLGVTEEGAGQSA